MDANTYLLITILIVGFVQASLTALWVLGYRDNQKTIDNLITSLAAYVDASQKTAQETLAEVTMEAPFQEADVSVVSDEPEEPTEKEIFQETLKILTQEAEHALGVIESTAKVISLDQETGTSIVSARFRRASLHKIEDLVRFLKNHNQ